MTPTTLLTILAAFLAGNMNAITGGGTFLTYPALLLTGNSSIVANATSTVALWPGILASLPGYKKEIRRSRKWIKALVMPALIGGMVGSFLLTHTSSATFDVVAPLLILTGALILQFEKRIHHFFHLIRFDKTHHRAIFVSALVLIIAMYGAYFGAGIGILFIGGLTLLGMKNFYQTIALKNVLSLIVNFTAVIYFSLSGIVHWQQVPWMVAASVAGGITGSHLVHRVNKKLVRQAVVCLGLVIAVLLFIIRTR